MSADSNRKIEAIHEAILSQGDAGRERFRAELRRVGLAPTPADREGSLYAPNPVVLPRSIVATMSADLDRFCAARLAATPDGRALRATMPASLRPLFGAREVADRLVDDLRRRAPFACLDAFPVATPEGMAPAYLEWQTFPAYPVTALFWAEALDRAFPGLEDLGAGFSGVPGESLAGMRERLRRFLLRGIEEDARCGVIIDYEPAAQETNWEFDLQVELSGGAERGLGVIDPREVTFVSGRPHYRRHGELLPITVVFSRLVHGDLEHRLLPALGAEERERLGRFFSLAEGIDWRVHPLHFLYGSKGDLPGFRAERLSTHIPACQRVTPDLIELLRESGVERLLGKVQKPVEGHGGRDVIDGPRLDELEPGALLQDRIEALACHPTANGPMTPELRVMGLPDEDGRMICSSVFTRVKSPEAFRSNAGAIARLGVAGTGEGYALLVD